MSDITDAGPRLKAINDALEEIDRLRKREAELLAAGDRLESQLCEAARERDRLRLTDAEREAVEAILGDPDLVLGDAREPLRGLLERFSPIAKCESDRSQPIATPAPLSTPPECTVPPEWTDSALTSTEDVTK